MSSFSWRQSRACILNALLSGAAAPADLAFGKGGGGLLGRTHFHQLDIGEMQSSAWEPEAVICSVLWQEILQLNLKMPQPGH